MKHMKRSNIYQCSNYNCTFNTKTLEAYSYRWWKFVAIVEGKVVFNNYRYSNSTSKHQSKVRALMTQLNIKIDIELPLPKGINSSSLADLYLTAEEYLCDRISIDEIKRQERNEKAAFRRRMKKLENILENEKNFRDYDIEPVSKFGKINKIAVHQQVNMNSIEQDIENAIYNFQRDGFRSVVFYV